MLELIVYTFVIVTTVWAAVVGSLGLAVFILIASTVISVMWDLDLFRKAYNWIKL